jgi:hypothetical protein
MYEQASVTEASPASINPIDVPAAAATSRDPLSEFDAELNALVQRWSERTGGRCEIAVRPTFIDEPPVEGFKQRRVGPLVEITLTVADLSRAGELLSARFPAPAAVRMAIKHTKRTDQSRTAGADSAISG